MATYYFDGSDAAATDPNSVWTSDSNAFDGSETTYSACTGTGSTSSNYLMAEGTNAPSSGNLITSVKARVYASNTSDSSGYVAIYTDGLGELLGSPYHDTTTTGWNAYVTLSTPTGGWTWAKVQALECKIYYDNRVSGSANIGMVQIEVLTSSTLSNTYRFVRVGDGMSRSEGAR